MVPCKWRDDVKFVKNIKVYSMEGHATDINIMEGANSDTNTQQLLKHPVNTQQ